MEPGSLELTVTWDGQQIVTAKGVSTRPDVMHALRALPLAQVREIIPRRFSLCRHAPGTAVGLTTAALACSLDPCVRNAFRVVDA